jgi:3',5'-cyclic-AMP phosphodiesterase
VPVENKNIKFNMIKKSIFPKIFLILIIFLRISFAASANDYYRIVVLGDPHLPVKGDMLKEPAKKQKIINAKENLIKDINNWDDVDRVVAVGDIAGNTGLNEEYNYAIGYFKKLNMPFSPVNGNHDYFFSDIKKEDGKLKRASAEERLKKLNYFKQVFNLKNEYYAQKISNYLLVFISVNSLESKLMTEMSQKELDWLSKTLGENNNVPTIIFYHAPLNHTLLDKNKPAEGWLVAQPYKQIDKIMKENEQVFLWVSGHTHTTPASKNYNSPVNLYDKRILNIHCADIDRQKIWTNSLYLYKHEVVVKTYNHNTKNWMEEMTRTIKTPVLK